LVYDIDSCRERCLYGALNNRIRRLLLSFDFTRAIDENQPFASHIASLLVRSSPKLSDITFYSDRETSFDLHKIVLVARSSFFARNLHGRWGSKKRIKLLESMDPRAFEAAVSFLYVGFKEFSLDLFEKMPTIAKKLEIPGILDLLNAQASRNHRRRRNARQCVEL